MQIRHILIDITQALKRLDEKELKGGINSYKKQKHEQTRTMLKTALQKLLDATKEHPEANMLAKTAAMAKTDDIKQYLEKLAEMAARETETKQPKLPATIKEEVQADLKEAEKCLKTECYRSSIILCGRAMETALHRKYYEATGNDLLEKAPGTGLGTLIAKLAEKGVKLEPGLTNQIHLINNTRIFSVHTKKEQFIPSKKQAEAIYLYTLDALDKMFV